MILNSSRELLPCEWLDQELFGTKYLWGRFCGALGASNEEEGGAAEARRLPNDLNKSSRIQFLDVETADYQIRLFFSYCFDGLSLIRCLAGPITA